MNETPPPHETPRSAIVLLAAGAGSRVGAGSNKVLLDLEGLPVLAHSVRTALAVAEVHRIVVVVRPGERDEVAAAIAPHLGSHDVWLVEGGAERHDSEDRALRALRQDIESGEVDVVAIHDAARPLAGPALFATALRVASRDGGAVPVVPATGLSRRDGSVAEGDLVGVQTPQAFAARALLQAYDAARGSDFTGTDTAAFLERFTDVTITAIAGEAGNLKVTYPEDLALAAELVKASSASD